MLVSAFSSALLRPTASVGGSARAEPETAAAPDGDASADPLAMLEDFVRSAAESRKQFAADRVKQLQEQMTKLMLFNLSPGALAGQSARMAKELENAATDFSGAIRTLGERTGTGAPTGAAETYLDVIDAAMPAGTHDLSAEDRETAGSFAQAARMLDGVTDAALRSLDRDDRDGQADARAARGSTSRVLEMMNRLGGADRAAP